MGLGLTWHDVVHMYECHKLASVGYYLKSRSEVVRLISYLPKSNKGMKDDYLIASGEWSDGFHCPTRAGDPSVVPFRISSLGKGFNLLVLFLLFGISFFDRRYPFSDLTIILLSVVLQIKPTLLLGSAIPTFKPLTTS